MNEQEIRRLVDLLLGDSTEMFSAEWKLKELGEEAVPALLRALADSRYYQKRKAPESQLPGAPVERVLRGLQPYGPSEAIPFLLPLVSNADEYFRKEAGLALGSIGTEDCIEPIRVLLRDPQDYVRSYTMIGIDWARRGHRGTPRFLAAAFDAVVPLLDRPDESLSKAAETLLLIDRDRAVPAILDERYFHLGNPVVLHSVYALNKSEVVVPVEKLSGLINPIADQLSSYPNDAIYGACLIALARTGHPDAEPAIQECLRHPNKRLREDAAEALSVLKGASKTIERVFTRMDKVGFDSLTDAEKTFASVRMLIDEVNNGGFDQYLSNSSGDYAADSLRGVRAIGARQTEELLQRALNLFGPDGPSPDSDTRREQLESLPESAHEELSELDDAFYKDTDEIEKKLHLYVAANRSSFKAT